MRAVLRQECGWTPVQSRLAHRAGIRRGKLLQDLAGHPGLAKGRQRLQGQGWPNLRAGHAVLADLGYSQLARGRANLSVRGWPNWQKARAALAAQGYLPLVEALRLRYNDSPLPPTDRRIARGRTTRLAILEAMRTRTRADGHARETDDTAPRTRSRRVIGREIAAQLHLHPTTVYAHLKQLQVQGLIE